MKPVIRKSLPVLILVGLLIVAAIVYMNPPKAEFQTRSAEPQMSVQTMEVVQTDYQIDVASYGIVRPRIQSILASQVAGQIVEKAPNFDEGGYFTKGDVLLRIDPRDYEADVRIAEAIQADARQALAEERARAEQARIDWTRLGNTGEAPELVLRKPQLLAAEARVASAAASLTKARLDLERTEIRAPFDGRVLRQFVDLGQVVSTNTQVAEIYSIDLAEVRLPIANSDLKFVDLPEGKSSPDSKGIAARIYADLIADEVWDARIVRTEGAIDDSARQLHVLAEIDDPFQSDSAHRAPLKIGQYVTARITGRTLSDVFVIPTKSIYQGSYVYIVENGLLQRRAIDIAWSDTNDTLVASGLETGDQLVLTTLGQVTSGVPVSISGSDRPERGAGIGTDSDKSAR